MEKRRHVTRAKFTVFRASSRWFLEHAMRSRDTTWEFLNGLRAKLKITSAPGLRNEALTFSADEARGVLVFGEIEVEDAETKPAEVCEADGSYHDRGRAETFSLKFGTRIFEQTRRQWKFGAGFVFMKSMPRVFLWDVSTGDRNEFFLFHIF